MNNKIVILCFCIVAAAVVAAAALLANMNIRFKEGENTISVVGYATAEVKADTVQFGFAVKRHGRAGLGQLYKELQHDSALALDTMYTLGFNPSDIEASAVGCSPIYVKTANGGVTNQIEGYYLVQKFTVTTKNIDLAEYGLLQPQQLMEQGIEVDIFPLDYFCPDIDGLKTKLLAEAGANAREKAATIAEAGGFKLGALCSSSSQEVDVRGDSTKTVTVEVSANFSVEK